MICVYRWDILYLPKGWRLIRSSGGGFVLGGGEDGGVCAQIPS